VGIEQCFISLATTPKHITCATQLFGHLNRLGDLSCRKGEDVSIAAGRRSMQIAGMGEEVGGSPKQPDAGTLLLFLQDFYDLIKVSVRLGQRFAFRRDIAVMKGVERRAELVQKFKGHSGSVLGIFD